jgi:hypothetical protein
MATVHKATIDLFDHIYPLLEYFNITGMNRDKWFQLLSTRRSARYDHFGYVLMEEEKAVGFLGAMFYERTIGGREESLCNLFCWYVLEEYRSGKGSLLLLLAAVRNRYTTITSLTSSAEALPIYERFQFTPLETKVRIFCVRPSVSRGSSIEFISDPGVLESRLNSRDRKLFQDHRFPACHHLMLVSRDHDQPYCYLVYNRVRKKGLYFTQICFISNAELFNGAFSRLQWFFFRHNRTLLTVMDKRLLAGLSPGPGLDYTLRYPRLFRSVGLQPEQVDNLYTELLFLQTI